jgi:hypothetical protein
LRELENLVRMGQLKREPPVASEVGGLLRSGEARLADATKQSLSLESRFDLAYNAAHALALAALRLRPRPRTRLDSVCVSPRADLSDRGAPTATRGG